jgi:phosphoribosylamine--glycine ligase
MKVLVVGSGGREHALCHALTRSAKVREVHCAPGNGGIEGVARCHPDVLASDLEGLADLAEALSADLTVIGPEAPLVQGVVDLFLERGLRVFGPTRDAARLEGSKRFAKDLMRKHGVPTADYHVFHDAAAARDHLEGLEYFPVVLKADGIAAGKGVTICHGREEALVALRECMDERRFGDAGSTIVVEEFLRGEEASVHAITDGETLFLLPTAQDHKAIGDGDQGPNTGGMGAYSPAPLVEGPMLERVVRDVLVPVLNGLKREGVEYRGVLYAGLMITRGGPRVLEFNARFGDPEAEVILPRLQSDLFEVLYTAAGGRLSALDPPVVDERPCVGVVMASQGYPGTYQAGKRIEGLDAAARVPGVTVFHAGTLSRPDGIYSAGGRVLCVSALGADYAEAVRRAYEGVGAIRFENAYNRTDIARRALARQGA